MALRTVKHIDHPKYDVRRVTSVNGFVGYCIKLYLIFADAHVYTLFTQDQWIEQLNLIRESGTACTSFTHELIVTPTHHWDIYNEILPYV